LQSPPSPYSKHLVQTESSRYTSQIGSNTHLDLGEVVELVYVVELKNHLPLLNGSKTISSQSSDKDKVLRELQNFKPEKPNLAKLRILLNGSVGAGKSSFINSIRTIFQGRITVDVPVDNIGGESYTWTYKTYNIENRRTPGSSYAFAFNDVMGLEGNEGVLVCDIINALKGHVKEGYKFNPRHPLTEEDGDYNKTPSLGEKVHCLVTVVAADTVELMSDEMVKKLREIRLAARDLDIPEVVALTKVDVACPLVAGDLKMVYKSRYIKKRIQVCSSRLGVPVYCIFPVQNYHEENHLKDDIDALLLNSLKHIVTFADDYLREYPGSNENLQSLPSPGGEHLVQPESSRYTTESNTHLDLEEVVEVVLVVEVFEVVEVVEI
ncbi:hypothetical protein JZ751_025685, partial [Albula glossodonta]